MEGGLGGSRSKLYGVSVNTFLGSGSPFPSWEIPGSASGDDRLRVHTEPLYRTSSVSGLESQLDDNAKNVNRMGRPRSLHHLFLVILKLKYKFLLQTLHCKDFLKIKGTYLVGLKSRRPIHFRFSKVEQTN